MSETQKYRTLCCKEQWLGGIFEHIALQGDALALEAGAYAGAACLPPVDSGEAGFGWRRLRLLAQVPPEAAVRVLRMWSPAYRVNNGQYVTLEEYLQEFERRTDGWEKS